MVEVQEEKETRRSSLVLKEQYFSLSQIFKSNDHLDHKALLLLLVSSLLLDTSISSRLLFLAVSVCCGLVLYFGGTATLPGTSNWDQAYNDYLYQEPEGEYQQILSDILDTYKDSKDINCHKGKWLRWAGIIFLVYTFAVVLN